MSVLVAEGSDLSGDEVSRVATLTSPESFELTVCAVIDMGGLGTPNVANHSRVGGVLLLFACLAIFSTTAASGTGCVYLSEIPKPDLKSVGRDLDTPNHLDIVVRAGS